jgi:hypothetical protein
MEIQGAEMLTNIFGVCYAGFINPVGDVAGVWILRLALCIGST